MNPSPHLSPDSLMPLTPYTPISTPPGFPIGPALNQPNVAPSPHVSAPPGHTPRLSAFDRSVQELNKNPRRRRAFEASGKANLIVNAIESEDVDYLYVQQVLDDAPTSFRAAVFGPNAEKWMEAIQKEFDALTKNGTWTLVPIQSLPAGTKVHQPIWRFRKKLDGQFKAWFCFDGRRQIPGIDVFESSSQVPSLESVQVVITAMIQHASHVIQFDVLNAFLHSTVDVDIYMRQPAGFCTNPNLVCKLNKALYGLVQSPLLWQQEIHSTLTIMDFLRSAYSNCIYFYHSGDTWCLLIVYVDDILVTSNNTSFIDSVIGFLNKRYSV